MPGAPTYDVCENFCGGGVGMRLARLSHHGEGSARVDVDDDVVVSDRDSVDEVLEV
ncbi:MAG TPA: hypothetical protein VJN18_01975 [Polyangiaceae bacterium]|nr:hypothetical protein [Polyangiaceae bacterium]